MTLVPQPPHIKQLDSQRKAVLPLTMCDLKAGDIFACEYAYSLQTWLNPMLKLAQLFVYVRQGIVIYFAVIEYKKL